MLTLAAVIATVFTGFAQNTTSSLAFDPQTCDLGTIREEDGPVNRTFSFRNYSDRPVAIERIKADCGCTTADFDASAVNPGGSGELTVTFDPSRMAGQFVKRITVYGSDGSRNLLTLTGNIIGRPLTVEEAFPFELGGGIRADAVHFAFGYIANGSARSMTMKLVNTSSGDARIDTAHDAYLQEAPCSGRLKIAAPTVVPAGSEAVVTLTYDLTDGDPVWGMLSDRTVISVNGTAASLPLGTSAIAVDDFGPGDAASAAHCRLAPVRHDFGEIEPLSRHDVEITLVNDGKSPLVIRGISLRRNTECDLREGTEVAPGATLRFRVTLIAGELYGTVTGGVTFVVNDPARPFREIRVGGEVW